MVCVSLILLAVALGAATAHQVWRDRQEKKLLSEEELKERGFAPIKSPLFDSIFCGLLVAVLFYLTAHSVCRIVGFIR